MQYKNSYSKIIYLKLFTYTCIIYEFNCHKFDNFAIYHKIILIIFEIIIENNYWKKFLNNDG